jgi:DNA repair protein RAD16
VRFVSDGDCHFYYQAEKTTIALRIHHPELADIWGDLERNIGVVAPQKAEQPQGLKVSLLPFQRESLFWMRQQEKGEWGGGLLADEMGYFLAILFILTPFTDHVLVWVKQSKLYPS